jgi:hypothetical protein
MAVVHRSRWSRVGVAGHDVIQCCVYVCGLFLVSSLADGRAIMRKRHKGILWSAKVDVDLVARRRYNSAYFMFLWMNWMYVAVVVIYALFGS